MKQVNCTEDLIDELNALRACGVRVSDAACLHAYEADITLFSLLGRHDAALLILRRAASPVRQRFT